MVAEKWTEAVQDVEDVGVELLCSGGPPEVTVDKGEFADDVVLVASTREAAQAVGTAYVEVGVDSQPAQDQVYGSRVWSDG